MWLDTHIHKHTHTLYKTPDFRNQKQREGDLTKPTVKANHKRNKE